MIFHDTIELSFTKFMKLSKLKFTTKSNTTKRPYAYILVYTPTPTLILAPVRVIMLKTAKDG